MKKLYKYQVQALSKAIEHDEYLLALDMGLGKTITALHWIKYWQNKNKVDNKPEYNTFIVCDSKKVNDWESEAKEIELSIYKLKSLTRFSSDLRELFAHNNGAIIIMSYNILRNLLNSGFQFINPINLVIDESQVLKNPKSKLTKLIRWWSFKYAKLLLLSGDPISKGYQNLYSQMMLLNLFDKKYRYKNFVNDYCRYYIPTGKHFQIINGYKNTEDLLETLYLKSYFLKTEQAIELPEQRDFFINTEIPKEYADVLKDKGIIKDKSSILCDTSIKLLHTLRQLCSGYFIDDKTKSIINVNDSKLSELNSLIENSTYSFSIFYNYVGELNTIKEFIKENHPEIVIYEINGQNDQLNLAISEQKRMIVLIQYQSGARGIDGLQHKIFNQIYYSLTLSGELFKQSKKRIHRIGQNQKVNYYYLFNKNSIENKIYKTLEKSIDYTLEMFNNDFNLTGEI
ncbi:DEAD/DEAH box helicase [Mycoplasmopsis felis]|uniref:DEAD/DEAH box helicase n=1 Tax=Mycoplasmopsis felis TaxID=33923 RepID=UPI002AFEE60B|nr:DEAD/DEAH box helicase [Mycoplasmopsis felis]WQQ10464.1 DEAD/DEAH box helicase [Mycoplasmopsis felis]